MRLKKSKRPINFFIFSWALGLIGGTLYIKDIQGWPLFCVFFMLALFGSWYFWGKRQLIVFAISFLLGICMLLLHPTTQNRTRMTENMKVTIVGTVKEIKETEDGQNLILDKIMLEESSLKKSLQGKVQLQVSLSQKYFVGERVKATGIITAFPSPMNPSDFDYGQYLKSQNIVGVVKAKSCHGLGGKPNLLVQLRNVLSQDLEEIFEGTDEGIMQAALLGDDTALEEEAQSLYSAAGIGHILCVSGFHVALVTGFLLGFGACIGLPYAKRYIFAIGGIWSYALMSGMSTSTVRASIMATLVMGARLLWEEEDFWVSIGVSAFLILVWRPYSIFTMGFQLSFSAVSAIGISSLYLKKWEKTVKGVKKRMLQMLVPWFVINLLTSPIIAFHYFEIPFLSSILNLLVLPIFSVLILLGWCMLGSYLIGIPAIWPLTKGISTILAGVHKLCEIALKIPFGTICTGRPSGMMILVYYGLLILIGLWAYGMKLSKKIYGISLGGAGLWLGINLFMPNFLQVAYLYVGQGDGSVIETPHQKIVVIDGGPFGKGKVVERYIKYSGKKEVEAVMVSHSDSDHIGGIIEIVQGNLKINYVIISRTDESELLDTLIALCEKKEIPVIALKAAEEFKVDDVSFNILAPKKKQDEANNNSIVCLAAYKNFKALFMGDKEKESDSDIYNDIAPISLLKVSHHGSKTGTEEKLLLKLQPQYAMISCGINNRYGHPHEEVLKALKVCDVPYERTDLQGAIWVKSDGKKMTLYTQKKE